MKKYTCYTDGSYKSSIDCGAYGILIYDESGNLIKKLSQGYKGTTNNRMELMAVLETLKWFKEPSNITIISDSMYVVNTINEGWLKKWFDDKDYSKSNLDLWFQVLDYLDYHKVTMLWTKGHASDDINNQVDELAQFAATCLNLPKDEYINNSKTGR